MSLLIGLGTALVSTLGAVYVARKGWYAFHRVVGITPGAITYEPATQPSASPSLMQLTLDDAWLTHLPTEVLEQLSRIDHKADIYQQWQEDLAKQGQTVPTSEAQFTVRKLLNERLPEMLGSYHILAQHQNRVARLNDIELTKTNITGTSQDLQPLSEALGLLAALLDSTEQRLDELLAQCRDSSYQELLIMQRYLKKLNDTSA